MEIFIGIIAALLLLIIILLQLPVHIIIKKDAESGFDYKIKVLFFEIGKDDNSDSKTSYNIKKLFGLNKKSEKDTPAEKKTEGFFEKITHYSAIISDAFKEITSIIKKITIKKLHINIVCAEENAADTAICYGRCCAIVLPIVAAINSLAKVKKNAEKINISCDYTSEKGIFDFDIQYYVRFGGFLSALIRLGFKQIKRSLNSENKKTNTVKK